jgi:ELWxxDGT repeat protein
MSKFILFLTLFAFHYQLLGQAQWVKDINPMGSDVLIQKFAYSTNQLCFVATDGKNGFDLFLSDGTALGTNKLFDFFPGDSTGTCIIVTPNFNQRILCLASKSGSDPKNLYLVDVSTKTASLLATFTEEVAFGPNPVLGDKVIFQVNSGSVSQGTRKNVLWVTDGTVTGTKKLSDICAGCTLSGSRSYTFNTPLAVIANGRLLYKTDGTINGTSRIDSVSTTNRNVHIPLGVANGKLVFGSTNSVTAKCYFSKLDLLTGLGPDLDSTKLLLGRSYTDESAGRYYQFYKDSTLEVDLNTGKVLSFKKQLVTMSNQITKCGDNLFFMTVSATNPDRAALAMYDVMSKNSKEILVRNHNISVTATETPLCYQNAYLVGEWSTGNLDSGIGVFDKNFNLTFFNSGRYSFEFEISGNKIYWTGALPDQSEILWSLDLTTVPTTEPLPAQLDLSVYPTITTDGVFYLGGTDAQTDLMSAQLVNSAGSIIHVNTQVSTGEPLNFGTKAPGVYFVYLLSKDGRRFMQKVVYR